VADEAVGSRPFLGRRRRLFGRAVASHGRWKQQRETHRVRLPVIVTGV